MRNLDLLKTIDQQNMSRKASKLVCKKHRFKQKPIKRVERPVENLKVYKVPEFGDRSENYHDFCGESYEDWKGWEPNSWGY